MEDKLAGNKKFWSEEELRNLQPNSLNFAESKKIFEMVDISREQLPEYVSPLNEQIKNEEKEI